ncbi:MAG TPA: hypothetical protein PKN36_01510 [bacterium]|nr:hypothetical protein [bacterium]
MAFLNPIVIKELRQMVRSQYLVSIVFSCLFLQLLVSGIYFSQTEFIIDTARGAGGPLFGFLLGILGFVSCVFIPVYILARLARERSGCNLDFLYVTTLTSGAIVRGKFFSSLIVSLMLFSLSAPFLTLTYFLRGISLPVIFMSLYILFLANALLIQGSIFFGSLFAPNRKSYRILTILFALIMSAGAFYFFYFGLRGFFRHSGYLPDIKMMVLWATGIFVTIYSFIYACSVSLLMPGSTNKSLPVRVTFTVIWITNGIIAGIFAFAKSNSEIIEIWVIPSLVFLSLLFLWVVSERESPGPRLRKSIPAHRLKRIAVSPFFTGSANGMVWIFILGIITIVCLFLFIPSFASTESVKRALIFFLYVSAYSLTGAYLRRTALRNRVPYYQTWAIVFILMGLIVIIAFMVSFIREIELEFPDSEILFLPTVIASFFLRSEYLQSGLIFGLFWFAAALLINSSWLVQRLKDFKRECLTDETGISPISD